MTKKKYSNKFNGIPTEFIEEYNTATTGSKENEEKYPNGICEFLSDELIKARDGFNINFNVGIELSETGWIYIKKLYIDNIKETFKYTPNMIDEYVSTIDEHFEKHTQIVDDKKYFVDQLWEIMSIYGALFYNGSNYLNSTNIVLLRD